MDYGAHALHGTGNRLQVTDVAANGFFVRGKAGYFLNVEQSQPALAVREFTTQAGADDAGSTGDQYGHGNFWWGGT